MKLIICILTFFLAPLIGFPQQKKNFTLVVKTQSEISKHIGIGEAYFLEGYWAASFCNDSAAYTNAGYTFSGELLYPTAVRIFAVNSGTSFNELVFIEEGYQEIHVAVIDGKVHVRRRPSTEVESDYKELLTFFQLNNLDKQLPADALKKYVRRNPGSYAALFCLIDQTFNHGLNAVTRDLASHFSTEILGTKGFRFFEKEYLLKRKFGSVEVKDAEGKQVLLKLENDRGKYSLIEFWFAGCKGCIPLMKSIRDQYYNRLSSKVRIISVSVDAEQNVPISLRIVKDMKIQWESYWDYDAVAFSKQTLLYVYPTNLLIDDKGFVVGKDISMSQLDSYLQKLDRNSAQ